MNRWNLDLGDDMTVHALVLFVLFLMVMTLEAGLHGRRVFA